MQMIRFLFYAAGVCFCIAGFIGHSQAFAAAAVSFFAAIMMTVRQIKKSK